MVKRRVRFALWWRRSGMGLRSLVFLLAVSVFSLLIYWQQPEDEAARGQISLLVLILVNLNIVILCVLAFLIGRNVVKLVFDRRRKILGSQLRMRLVAAFVGLTLVPTIILFVLASGLLTRAMEGWFSSQMENSTHGAVEVARNYLSWLKDQTRRFSRTLVSQIQTQQTLQRDKHALETFLEKQRTEWAIFSISLLDRSTHPIVLVHSAAASIADFSEPPPDSDAVERALKSETQVLSEEKEASQFIRTYAPVRLNNEPAVLMVTLRVNPELTQALTMVNDSYREYEQLKYFKQPIKSGYILTLSMITGLLLFSAIWIAFYIARELAVPIQRLAEATRSIAKGRYDIQIRERGSDEMALLVRSFNQMTSDLKQSRREVERRRVYIETILANLAVGVIGINSVRKVGSVNAAAARIFGLEDALSVIGKPVEAVLTPEAYEKIVPMLEAFEEVAEESQQAALVAEREMTLTSQGRQLKVLCTAGQLRDDAGKLIGFVLLFDDITELSKAQHMSAWREVAQRIAHEIKNPLTPIRLSAQRLAKLVKESPPQPDSQEKVVECSQTIVEHVDSIKRLADEFSHFARMPRAEFGLGNLNGLISDSIAPFAESHPEIVFQFIADNQLPEIPMDREQMRRVLMNLIDNAIVALSVGAIASQEGKRITIRTTYDKRRRIGSFEVSDNGPGIKDSDKTRIFEPYFTTKEGGTGLGLAIVTSIVADHQGEIRVYDSPAHGAKFVVDLPLSQTRVTQRRFARA